MNYRTRTQHRIPNLITEGIVSQMIDGQEKAEAMTNYFRSFHSGASSRRITRPKYKVKKSSAHFGLRSKRCTLDMKKSIGLDELHSKILRQIAQDIAVPSTTIFNMSLDQGELPTNWKGAIVTPIHKTGSRQLPSNYRPVSFTSVVVKILGRMINKMMTSVETNNLLNSEHGFRKRLSCTSNLFIARELDRGFRQGKISGCYLHRLKQGIL
ncbi:unnamed protein product [Schistosoma mattheei]|uniref:Reverse transcriptase domain-containing protein n=1 Tax=Schistosoma mattheei TaxID=31246 RepID=A0AA85BAB9_9TREM|nr:unnamed protein product [Schistosoma mattheei]